VTYAKAESGVVLRATRTSGDALASGDSAAFTVNPGAATTLAFTTQPGSTTAGSLVAGPPAVAVRDNFGNTVTSSTASITIGIGTNPGGALSGTLTKNASSGAASFGDLAITKSGAGYTLTASATGLTGATSAAFDINQAPAFRLAFITQPANTSAGSALAGPPTVAVQDSLGNTVTSSTASITLAIGTNPGAGTLGGAKTKNAASGAAAFTDLSIDKAGSGYVLNASATGLAGATSNVFDITTGAAANLAFTRQPATPTPAALFPDLPQSSSRTVLAIR
jgi:hypothetical protein